MSLYFFLFFIEEISFMSGKQKEFKNFPIAVKQKNNYLKLQQVRQKKNSFSVGCPNISSKNIRLPSALGNKKSSKQNKKTIFDSALDIKGKERLQLDWHKKKQIEKIMIDIDDFEEVANIELKEFQSQGVATTSGSKIIIHKKHMIKILVKQMEQLKKVNEENQSVKNETYNILKQVEQVIKSFLFQNSFLQDEFQRLNKKTPSRDLKKILEKITIERQKDQQLIQFYKRKQKDSEYLLKKYQRESIDFKNAYLQEQNKARQYQQELQKVYEENQLMKKKMKSSSSIKRSSIFSTGKSELNINLNKGFDPLELNKSLNEATFSSIQNTIDQISDAQDQYFEILENKFDHFQEKIFHYTRKWFKYKKFRFTRQKKILQVQEKYTKLVDLCYQTFHTSELLVPYLQLYNQLKNE